MDILTQKLLQEIIDNPQLISKGIILSNDILNKIFSIILKNTQNKYLSRKSAISILNSIMQALEKEIKKTISSHSILFWLQITRRLPSDFWLESNKSHATALLARKTLDLSIVKYGKYETNDLYLSNSKTYTPNYSKNDLVQVFYLIQLCLRYYYETAAFRRINKGDRMKIINNNHYELKSDPSLNKMMKFYDKRIEKYNGLFNMFAHIGENHFSQDSFAILIAYPSFDLPDSFTHGINFLSSRELKELVLFWQRIGVSIRGFSVIRLVSLLAALFHSRLAPEKPNAQSRWGLMQHEIQSKGYLVINLDALSNDLKYVYPIIFNSINGSNEHMTIKEISTDIDRFIKVFSINSKISLLKRSDAPLFIKLDNLTIIDWTKIVSFTHEWLDKLNESSHTEIATERGLVFQEEVKKYIEKECPSLKLWPKSREYLYKGKSKVAHIDIGYIKNSFYFLIECKIKLINSNYSSGDKSVEDHLWKNLNRWLVQVDRTADSLKNRAHLINGDKLPEEIQFIVPLVCTNLVMFIRDPNPYYFQSDEFPRVCTPKELISILNSPNLDFLKNSALCINKKEF